MLNTFPQLQTYNRLDIVRGPERNDRGFATAGKKPVRDVDRPNITYYFAPLPIRLLGYIRYSICSRV
jgi:hypothetical protein